MKKLYMFLAGIVAVMGFASCTEDTDPKLNNNTEQIAASFTINTPALQDQYINLVEGETFNLSCSQPDYGFSAVANYSALVSLTEDFSEFYEIESTKKTLAYMTFKDEDLALAICQLMGLTKDASDEERAALDKPCEVYFKAVCEIPGVENTRVVSKNVVSLNYVKPYFAVPTPAFIYLVGNPEGWAGPTESNASHYADWRLFENDEEIGSKVFHGTFEMPAAPMFRFYTALTGWDADSYGSQPDDNPIDFDLVDGQFSNPIVKGKGSFNFPTFAGGTMEITVDMNAMVLTIRAI